MYFQQKSLQDVSRAYGAIRPKAAAMYLGLDPELAEQHDASVINELTSHGWIWDSEKKLLYPKRARSTTDLRETAPLSISEITALLGDYGS